MPKLLTFDIVFNNPDAIYMAGSTVSGYVLVELNDAMMMRGLRLKCVGQAGGSWDTRKKFDSSGAHTSEREQHNANETYFFAKFTLWGKQIGEGGENPVHPMGKFKYPFEIELPTNIPSSFEGTNGHVRYWCRANIDKPWKFDHTAKRAFTVVSILDLNTHASAMKSIQRDVEKHLCLLCCRSGPVTLTARLEREGYVSGEDIPIHLTVDNLSRTQIQSVHAILMQKVTYFSGAQQEGESLSNFNEIVRIEKGKIRPGHTQKWDGTMMHIPALPPSELIHCKIIDTDYFIDFEVEFGGFHRPLTMRLPILIGTIPLKSTFSNFDAISEGEETPATAESLLVYPDMPTPSFESNFAGSFSIRDEDDTQYTRGSLDFAPLYPVYISHHD